jgi:hypothetical protein
MVRLHVRPLISTSSRRDPLDRRSIRRNLGPSAQENDVPRPDPDTSVNTDNPKPGKNRSPGADGEVGGEGRSSSSGSGGDGGDDSERTTKTDDKR